jgi:hypothetical protein
MHVMGARFETLAAANAALRDVRGAATVAPGDVAVRPLGSMRYEVPATGFVLGGRIGDGDVQRVRHILEAYGGSILVCRPEAVTAAGVDAATAAAAASRAAIASNPPWTPARTGAIPHPMSRPRVSTRMAGPRLRKRLRRPVARLRGRAARGHRFAGRRQ